MDYVRSLEGVLKMHEVVPKHQAFIQLLCFNPVAKVHTQAAANSTSPCADRHLGSCVVVGLPHSSLGTRISGWGEAQLQSAQPSHGASCTAPVFRFTAAFLDFESNPGAGTENIQFNLDSFAARHTWHLKRIPLQLSFTYGLGLLKASLSRVRAHHCWGPSLPTETLAASANDAARLLPFQSGVSGSIAQLLSPANL